MEVVVAIAVVVVGLVVTAMVWEARRQRRRRERLVEWATRHGWEFTPAPAVDWASRLPGRNKRGVSFALSASVGHHPVSVGEYSYTETHVSTSSNGAGGTTTSTTSHTHHFIVLVVRLARSYQPVAVQPRSGLSKFGRRLGKDDPNATGDDRFDRRFKVHTADPRYARQLIGPGLVAEHLAGTVPPWNLYGTELLAYRPGRLDHPDQLPTLVAPLVRVAELLGQ
jgi:hypothetical protein